MCGKSAQHMSHTAGINRALKADAAQHVRRSFKREIASQMEDIEVPEVTVDPKAWYKDHAEAENLLEAVTALMVHNNVCLEDVAFVNHSCGSISWVEFAAVAAGVTYYESNYSVYDLDDLFAVVGHGWWISVIHAHDEEYLGFRRIPAEIPYHVTPEPAHFNWPLQ